MENQELGRADIIADILWEREEAFAQWGDQDDRPNNLWLGVVAARTSTIERAMGDPSDLYDEVIQAATILVAWAEALKRKEILIESEAKDG